MSIDQLFAAAALQAVMDQTESRKFDLSIEALVASYLQHEPFRVGDVVEWKKGLKNVKIPDYGEDAVVMEAFDTPILNPEPSAGSSYFRESLDVKLAVRDCDGELIFFHFDSRRFKLKRRYMTETDLEAGAA